MHELRELDFEKGRILRPKFEARFDVVDRPEDFLVVGSQGNPDLSQQPLAISIATVSGWKAFDTETSIISPVKQNGAQFLLAHEGLVAPIHEFLSQKDNPVAQLADFEKTDVKMIATMNLSGELGIIAAHVLYPSVEGDEPSSILLLSRKIADARGTVGDAAVYNNWQRLDVDLPGLIAQEQAGTPTKLGENCTLEVRTLAAIGMLARQETMKEHIDLYRETVVIEAGTMPELREE